MVVASSCSNAYHPPTGHFLNVMRKNTLKKDFRGPVITKQASRTRCKLSLMGQSKQVFSPLSPSDLKSVTCEEHVGRG